MPTDSERPSIRSKYRVQVDHVLGMLIGTDGNEAPRCHDRQPDWPIGELPPELRHAIERIERKLDDTRGGKPRLAMEIDLEVGPKIRYTKNAAGKDHLPCQGVELTVG